MSWHFWQAGRLRQLHSSTSRWGRHFSLPCVSLAAIFALQAQPPSFDPLYQTFEKAGCRACHNPEGVASPTRLRFPDPDAPSARIPAFGKSLVELVDRQDPENSILLRKPTNRIQHSGGERIRRGSEDEVTLKAWIAYLAR